VKTSIFLIVFSLLSLKTQSQNVSLYKQFNGRFDFTFVGNTLNTGENNVTPGCSILNSSSATLNLTPNDVIENAYLYWAGSGTGDFNIKLNNVDITPQRTFFWTQTTANQDFFSAFRDVTQLVKTTGNGIYTVSDFDLNAVINAGTYCNNRTNFGGWAIVIIYKNNTFPINQLNIYDGLQGIPQVININLNSLNVIDNVGAKIGFIAWEGDSTLSVNETLKINGNTLSNSLNPATNAFNSTNSITNSTSLYNMDLDIYDIQNNIAVGDASATVQMTSGQDFVMINTIITKLNSQLPDATIKIDNHTKQCNSQAVKVNYTVYNTIATNPLPANVSIAFFADNIFVGQAFTANTIPIGSSENGSITLQIPTNIPNNFVLKAIVDSNNLGIGSVTEILENNNTFLTNIKLIKSPNFNLYVAKISCNLGLGRGIFDFSDAANIIKTTSTDVVTFFETNNDAISNTNPIINTSNYTATTTPKTITVRIENLDGCQSISNFELNTKNCPPTVYNAVSADGNGQNDTFFIDGLRDVFLNHQIFVYNRWGQIVWQGNNNIEPFSGISNKGVKISGNVLPEGTYFYVLELNDPDYTTPLTGYLYLTK
jgi:hypothetical protein